MADKNLHDIKIDELDSPKKTPLKNILTLLALLFIILVISVVITKLILNTDGGSTIENNESKVELTNGVKDTDDSNAKNTDETANTNSADAKDNETKNDTKVPVLSSTTTEKNLTSIIKTPLTSHTPKKTTQEIKETYKAPKKNTAPVKVPTAPKKNSVKTTTPKKSTSQPKKQYIDKVVTKKYTPSKTTSHKTASYLGGKRKDVTDSYYIKVGTYRDSSTVIAKIKKNNFNYAVVKVENDKTLTRVLVGPFFSRKQANSQLAKVKANILTGAYVTKAK